MIMLKLIILYLCIATLDVVYAFTTMPKSHLKQMERILSNHVNFSTVYRRSINDMLSSQRGQESDKNNLNMNLYDLDYETFLDILKALPFNCTRRMEGRLRNLKIRDLDHATFMKLVQQIGRFRYPLKPLHSVAKYTYFYEFTWQHLLEETTDHWNTYEVALRLMRHSIHFVRYRLGRAYSYKRRFENETSFYIAGIVSQVHDIILKCDGLYATLCTFPEKSHFLFHVNIYERILAANIDVEYMVHRAFKLHRQYRIAKRFREKTEEETMWQEILSSDFTTSTSSSNETGWDTDSD